MARSVLFAIGSRANWASCKAVVRACSDVGVTPKVLAFASAVLPRYGDVAADIEREGYETRCVATLVEGGAPVQMAETAGLTLTAVIPALEQLEPDVIYVVGDRYEVLPVAYAAHLLGIRVAHQMGGELSGTIDESVRHAITKCAHIHFAATEAAGARVRAMGEWNCHVTGCPRLDLARPYLGATRGRDIIIMQHPVTSEWDRAGAQMRLTLEAVERVRDDRKVHLFWPNADAGCEAIIRAVREQHNTYLTHRNLEPEKFLELLATCAVIVGNSSAAIREGSFLGTPAVNIGTRQSYRERAANVWNLTYDPDTVSAAITGQLNCAYPSSLLYGDGRSGPRIAEILAAELPPLQKVWTE